MKLIEIIRFFSTTRQAEEIQMTSPKTHSVEGWVEVDFNSEPFLTDFKEVYKDMHDSVCPVAHSPVGDHYAVA